MVTKIPHGEAVANMQRGGERRNPAANKVSSSFGFCLSRAPAVLWLFDLARLSYLNSCGNSLHYPPSLSAATVIGLSPKRLARSLSPHEITTRNAYHTQISPCILNNQQSCLSAYVPHELRVKQLNPNR